MTLAVIAGGRDRTPSLAEFALFESTLARRGVAVVREGDCRGTDKAVSAYTKARELAEVETWPADWDRHGPAAGPIRNRAMLAGEGQADLFGATSRPPADLLIAFKGGRGTADCIAAALERGLPVEWIPDADEPRPWNLHHGPAPGPSIYVGRSRKHGGPSPLANPFRVELEPGETRIAAAPRILDRYRRWLWARLNPRNEQHDPRVVDALRAITSDHYLACTCWPHHCHAEVVIAAWRWMQRSVG